MNYNLKEIFRGITPDNIRDIPVIKDSMEIFIEILKERSKQSIDLSTYAENKKIRNELFKTYLGDLYEVLDGIKYNQKIIDLITSRNESYSKIEDYEFISREVLEDMLNRISDEHFIAFRNFREKKGTIKAIEYMFHLIATLVNSPEGVDYIIIEGNNPFELIIEGTLPQEFYYYLIAPLAHPAGFTFAYAQSVVWELIDYFFPIETTYNVRRLDVNCVSIDPVTGLNVKGYTDFKDRTVIDIKRNTYVWPRIHRIYFGGEFAGEFLENLTYANGHSTVTLNNDNGIILEFGDYCTISEVIEAQIKQDDNFDNLILSLESTLRTSYNTVWDPINNTLEEFEDTVVKDEINMYYTYDSTRNPFMSWIKAPFWSAIGPHEHKWDNWKGVCYPDSIIETSISQADELPFLKGVSGSGRGLLNKWDNYPETRIGGEHLYISGKIEYTKDQISANFADVPDRYHPEEILHSSNIVPGKEKVLFGLMEFNNKEVILINPKDPDTKQAWVSGDAYNIDYVSRTKQVDEFFFRDDKSSHILPDCFETETNEYVAFVNSGEDINELEENIDCDTVVRFNSYIIRDDEYSYVFFNNVIVRFNDFDIRDDELSFVFFNDRITSDFGNTFKDNTERCIESSCDSSLGYNNSTKNGFFNNGFHADSDKFQFGVFRNGFWLPDNNSGVYEAIDINDDYEKSFEYGFDVDYGEIVGCDEFVLSEPSTVTVFDKHSDNPSSFEITIDEVVEDYEKSFDTITNQEVIVFDEDSDKIAVSMVTALDIEDEYNKSFDTTTNEEVIVFDENSDTIHSNIMSFDYKDDYEKSFTDEWITAFDENSDRITVVVGADLDLEDEYSKSFDTTTNEEVIVFDEDSDTIHGYVMSFDDNSDYEKSFTDEWITAFDENSDKDQIEMTNYDNSDYELSYEKFYKIGRLTTGTTKIGQRIDDVVKIFDEDSDKHLRIKDK